MVRLNNFLSWLVLLVGISCMCSISYGQLTAIPNHNLWPRPEVIPLPGSVTGVSHPVISLNGTWKISTDPPTGFWKNDIDITSWKDIPVPAQASMQGIRLQLNKEYAYKTKITIPKDFKDKRVLIRFEGVSGTAKAYINGHFLREHFGGYNIWSCDITEFVQAGRDAWLTIGIVDPPANKSSSGMDAGGILRHVKLIALPQNYLYRFNIETDFDTLYKNAIMKIWVAEKFNKGSQSSLRLTLKDPKGNSVALAQSIYPISNHKNEVLLDIPVANPIKWDAEHPQLYTLEASIWSGNEMTGTVTKKIGFREIEIRNKQLLINGKEVKLRGAGRFDSDPVYGRYLSDEQCRKEVGMLKDANLNHVRPSCYPAAEAYLDACDSLGLYVQIENSVTFTPGAKDSSLTPIFMSQMAEMIEAVRSRPSVIIYELANETYYGINIAKTYEYTKAEDPTRPVIYSWSQSVETGKPWPYDIFSYHYPDWDADLGTAGVSVFNTRAVRPLPANMPVLHDEFGHGSSYYQASLARDPGMRDFWGKSIKVFWERMFTTPGCIGGAMWAIIDDNASGGGAWAYEWGAIDLWRRERPEYWHFKKAFSPVRINEAPLKSPAAGKALIVPVINWYDHTNFDELMIRWSVKNQSAKLKAPSIQPHQSGTIMLPSRNWQKGDTVNLKFYDQYNRLIDEFNLGVEPSKYEIPVAKGPAPLIQENDKMISIIGKDFELQFSKMDGLIEKGMYKGTEIIKGGPYFQLTGGKLGSWKLRQLTAKAADKDEVVVTISGSYDAADIIFDLNIDGTGLIKTEYTLGRFNVPVPMPRKIPWDRQDAGGFEEVGIYYLLSENVDRLSWQRQGLWSAYPADHIGRNEGTANRYGKGPQKLPGKKPLNSWSQDELDFVVFGQYDLGGRGTNDFRSTKENVFYAKVIDSGEGVMVKVESGGKDAVRLEVCEDKSSWIDNNNAAIKFTGSWVETKDTMDFYGVNEMRSSSVGDYLEYAFTGTGIAWIGSKGQSLGSADVFIDGELQASDISFFNRSGILNQAVLFSKQGLNAGRHTIRIVAKQATGRNAQQNNSSSRPVSIPLDAFKILGETRPGKVKMIINNLWNQTKMGLGNYMKDPILIGSQYRNSVTIRLMENN